jgi:uncharacterized lipoprotein YehR (DUF1307 family)
MKIIFSVLLISFLFSCTENERAKKWGGDFNLKLEPNEELINITWKGDDLWYLVKNTKTGLVQFKEHSSYGVWEGEITIEEVKPEIEEPEKYSWEK